MEYQFSYSPYSRRFRQPLTTTHGVWKVREGIIVSLTDDRGISHQGEIAPIPWFGSESIAEAIAYCENVGTTITRDRIDEIPDRLPACQFGLGAAAMAFSSSSTPPEALSQGTIALCGLLPTGATALDSWKVLWAKGYSTFKWKIGVGDVGTEMAIAARLIAALPPTAKLRLDANGGLTSQIANEWLAWSDDRGEKIEFIEQPLAPDRVEDTMNLGRAFRTPIALDESVATFSQLQTVYRQGWRGIYVIKPGIAGFPHRLGEFITTHQLDVVLSSVLETPVGRAAALGLLSYLVTRDRAMGFGVDDWL